jgi:hypothetical protein
MASAFPKNTLIFFQSSTAPTGWTKKIINDDYTLRIVTGTSGGTLNNSGGLGFTTAMVDSSFTGTYSSAIGSVSTDDADIPAHTHTYTQNSVSPSGPPYVTSGGYLLATPQGSYVHQSGSAISPTAPTNPAATLAPASHSHTLTGAGTFTGTSSTATFAVKYLDFILASKDT